MDRQRTERPLAGRRVLLTRPESSGAGALARRLEALGARVASLPTIALVAPADPQPPRAAMERLVEYDWIVFTSPTGVRFFLEAARETGVETGSIETRIAVIGPATARALSDAGLSARVTAQDSRSEGLAAALGDTVRAGERVLLVRPEQARRVLPEALRALGAKVDAVAFYRNVRAPGVEQVAAAVCRGEFDTVVFTSPSTLHRLLEAGVEPGEVERGLQGLAIVAIGEVTAAAIRCAGLAVRAVAARPGEDGIVAALLEVAAG